MKRLVATVSGTLLTLFLLAPAMAGGNAPAQDSVQSAVPQSQIETQNKRQAARERRDAMLKKRAENIKAADAKDRKAAEKKKNSETDVK